MSTPSIQTLITQAQQVLNLKSTNEIRATLAAVLANANVGTPLNPNLTTQQLWDEFYEIVRQPSDDIMSIVVDQMMRMVFSPPAPGGAGADKQVIFNDGGVLAGDTKFLWDKNANRLDVDGPVAITGALTVATNTLVADAVGYTGKVGIATATPADFLEVVGNGATGVRVSRAGLPTQFATLSAGATGPTLNASSALGSLTFGIAGTAATAMTLDSTGLGIGGTPTEKLSVNGSIGFQNGGTQRWHITASSGSDLVFTRSSVADRFTITSDGNVGVGVTPSVNSLSASGYRGLEVGSVKGFGLYCGNSEAYLWSNLYYDGGLKYANSNTAAASFYQNAGQFIWYNAPSSGVSGAGTAATLTPRMTLDASGNLLVGTVTSPSGTKIGSIVKLGKVSVEGSDSITVTTAATPLARAFDTGGLFFVSGYNNVGGNRGWFLVAAGSTTPVVIASDNLTGLTVAFTSPSGVLNMNTTSGSLTVTSISLTNQGV
jgi:filamentous hemagglutinin